MATSKTGTRLKTLLIDLQSNDLNKVKAAIQRVRKDANEKVIPHLIKILNEVNDEPIKSSIRKILFELKNIRTIPYLLAGIKDSSLEGIRADLVSALWQSGFDVSGELSLFVELAIESDFVTAFECLTVIETMEGPFDEDALNDCIQEVSYILQSPTEKEQLLTSLQEALEDKLAF